MRATTPLLLFGFSLASAQTVTVQVQATTPTQAIIHTVATNADGSPYTEACTYRISEGQSFASAVNDVNPALFAGSNTDGRPGSIVVNKDHFFVAGTRQAMQALDHKYYSRALQANTTHWVGVTCGKAPEQGAVFTTLNIPLGNSYPELPAFDSGSFGNVAAPTIDWVDKTKTYIDPLTGVLLKRITSPLDYLDEVSVKHAFTYARDMNGAAWTNSQKAVASQSTTSFASTSTPDAPLFLPWAPGSFAYEHASLDASAGPVDIRLRAFCSAAGGATLQACISLDSGQTCATDAQTIACPASMGEVKVPSNYPAPMYSGWGVQHQTLSKNALSTFDRPNVSVSGNTVTWVSEPIHNIKFYANRAPGSKIQITNTAPTCPDNICTVASYDNPAQITIQESVPAPVTGVMEDMGAGIRVWMPKLGGTIKANFTYDYVTAEEFVGGVSANFDTCSLLPITDISTDAQGNPLPAPLTGYLCNLGQQGPSDLILWIPSTGESRLMSTFSDMAANRFYPPSNPFSATDPKTLFASDRLGHFWKATLNCKPGVYKAYVPVPGENTPDNLTWTNLATISAPIAQQLANFGGKAAAAYASGLFQNIRFIGVVGGYAYYNAQASQSGQDGLCMRLRSVADTNQLVEAVTSWDRYPMRWGACHVGAVGSDSFMNVVVNALEGHNNNSNPFGGPWRLNITQIHRGGGWKSFSEDITAATNAKPVQFTSPAHGLDPNYNGYHGTGPLIGPQLTISGGTGPWAAANGTWTANVAAGDLDHFTVPALDSSSWGPMPKGLTFSAAPPIIHGKIQSISSGTPAVVSIIVNADAEKVVQNHRLIDGDPIGFGSDPASSQYYAKVTGYSPTTFAVYSDPALTKPVSGAKIQDFKQFKNQPGMVYLAETCTGLDRRWTAPSHLDSGATGTRCISFRVAGEPCSYFANPGESSKFPCKSDPTNPNKSSLQDLQPGDAIRDIGRNGYTETMTLVKKVKNSDNDIELTFARWTPNQVQGGDDHRYYPYSSTHDVGWTPYLVPTNSHASATAWVDAKDPTHTFQSADPNYASQHGDMGHGNAPGLVTFVSGQAGKGEGVMDPIVNKTLQNLLLTPLTYTKNENPTWAGAKATQLSYDSHIQSYPGHRQTGVPPSEYLWRGDWNSLNPAFGSSPSDAASLGGGEVIAKVPGTAHVYKITNFAGAYDRKRTPTYAWAGRFLFRDMSGPGSLIADSNAWNYCVADFPGECRPGSAKNDTFISAPIFYDSKGACLTNTMNLMAPCFIGANPLGGWATQVQVDPVDTTATRFRKLTLGLSAPGMQWTFTTWLQTPGAQWGFFSAPYTNGLRNDYFAMKLPPWPKPDNIDRTTFIPVSVDARATGSAQFARARFGYAENGPAGSFFCTSRQESCATDIPASSPGDPYSFVSEAAKHQNCGSGCKIAIPAIPGRVLYYVVDELDSAGKTLATSPMTAVAVP